MFLFFKFTTQSVVNTYFFLRLGPWKILKNNYLTIIYFWGIPFNLGGNKKISAVKGGGGNS